MGTMLVLGLQRYSKKSKLQYLFEKFSKFASLNASQVWLEMYVI